jgi:hypothetical protein
MASTNAPNDSDSIIPADKNCVNCWGSSNVKNTCLLCRGGLPPKNKNNATAKPKPNRSEKKKHAYVQQLLDSVPEGDENDDYICQDPLTVHDFCQGCWRAIRACKCKEGNSETRPLPAYLEMTKRLLLRDKQLATDKEVH